MRRGAQRKHQRQQNAGRCQGAIAGDEQGSDVAEKNLDATGDEHTASDFRGPAGGRRLEVEIGPAGP